MAGLVDLHMLMLLKERWSEYEASVASFSALFSPQVSATVSAQWHADLVADKVLFRTAFTPEKSGSPLVVVQMQDEPIEAQPLGFQGGYSGTGENITRYYSMLVKEQVNILMFASNVEVLRALYVVVRASIMSSIMFLLDAGYESLEYLGGGDVQPEPGLLPETLGIFMRTQRWSVISDSTAADSTILAHKDVLVGAIDATIDTDGNPGGTTPDVD